MNDCECVEIEKYLRYKDVKPKESTLEDILTNTIVFEPTMVGKTSKKTFKLNSVTKPMRYVLKRDPDSNPIYRVFEMSISSDIVKAGKYLTCVVTYRPLTVDQKSVDHFEIEDSNLDTYKIRVQGESIGPNVGVSIKNLFFYNTSEGKNLMSTFEIRNIYSGEIHFNFDANENLEDQELFKIDKIHGVVSPCSYTYITIRFVGTQTGFYFNRLFCRVENHPPLLIRLFGIVSPILRFNPEHVGLLKISDKYPTRGFDGYMFDVIKSTIIQPPFSLSTNYIDFGSIIYQEALTKSKTLVTSLTNHLSHDITVIWMNDNEKVFSITPKQVTLPSNESVLFECSFKPDHCDRLFNKLIIGQVFWENFLCKFMESKYLEEIYVPLNISLVLSGRSFPDDKIWLPLVEMKPNVVVLPPTVPKNPSYATALLKSSGSLPTSFKFIPPKTTNFLLKPMEGIMYDFQVIVIQLQPDGDDKKAYVERWSVELNGRSDNCVAIFLKCFAENIFISIGNNYSMVFNTVQPGCQDAISIMVYNKTIHSIKYNFLLHQQDYFEINHPAGELASNEFVKLRCFLTGDLKVSECFSARCRLRNLSQIKMITGDSLDLSVSVYNRCIYSELCSTPSFYDFGEIEFGSNVTVSFYLFNFGESPLHFQLHKKEFEGSADDVKIVPTIGTITHKQKMKVTIRVKGTAVGDQKVEIAYKLRLHSTSNIIVDRYKERTVFVARLKCSYATVQICDIGDSNFGFLFTKLSLWNIFNIAEINHILANIKHEETKDVNMYLPEYEMGDADFYAKLVLRNITKFPTKVKFKWTKNCDCKATERSVGLSMRQKDDDCIHKNISKLSIESEIVKPSSNNVVQLDVKYLERDMTTVWYTISLAYNRTVNVFINVFVLPETVTMPSKYSRSFDFDLQPVFLGEQEPPAQAYPIYNNSAFNVTYEIDTVPLSEINFHYDFEIFFCLNPSGILTPFTSTNILLKFHPITIETYKAHVPIKMGDEVFILNITGMGSGEPSQYYENMVRSSPAVPEHPYWNIDVNLTSDFLVMKPFQVWMGRETMIFIRNQSSEKLIGYSWQNASQEGIAFVQALRSKGLLYPKESHAIPLRVIAFDQPCTLTLTMTCKLLDHSQHIKHKESVAAYYQREQEIEGHFTITEKGTFYPKNEVEILPKPEVFFTTLSITVCIISECDRDIYISLEDQLQQIPQNRLRLDIGITFIDYCNALLETIEKETHFRKIIDLKKLDFQNKTNILDMFKIVIELIFADIMHSEAFREYLHFSNNLYQPYYSQFVVQGEMFEPLLGKEILKKKRLLELKNHMELVKSFLNTPQPTTIEGIIKEILSESVHNVFQLTGRIKPEKGPFEYAYGTVKHRFRCPICQCKH